MTSRLGHTVRAGTGRPLSMPSASPNTSTTMAGRGSTFAWASRLLPQSLGPDVAQLYSFCRRVDDIADRSDDSQDARRRLAGLQNALLAGDVSDPLAARMLDLAQRYAFEITPAIALIEGASSDLGPVRIASSEDLLRYAYAVAGTVGEMMCPILGCRKAMALPFAIDLGVGMQLTNIARDVLEDAQNNRLYLPADRLDPTVTPHSLAAGESAARASTWNEILWLLTLAERYYRNADLGIGLLPLRVRPGILVASRVYEAIGTEIRRAGETLYWQRRAKVSRRAFLWQTLRALSRLPRPIEKANRSGRMTPAAHLRRVRLSTPLEEHREQG